MHELETDAINCVRSLAAIAIGSLLYDHRELFPRFRPNLEELLYDLHPAVRMAMVEVCLPVWNVDRKLAAHWFLVLAADDLRSACGRHAQRFCNCAFPEFTEQLAPLIQSMSESEITEVAEEGAQEATARWLFFGVFGDLVARCRAGTEPQRKGVAGIIARFVRDEKYSEKCWPILLELCDDPSSEIRQQASRALHDERILSTPQVADFLTCFLDTEAFNDDPGSLIDALQGHSGSLIPFADLIFATVSRSIDLIQNPDHKPERRMWLMTGT